MRSATASTTCFPQTKAKLQLFQVIRRWKRQASSDRRIAPKSAAARRRSQMVTSSHGLPVFLLEAKPMLNLRPSSVHSELSILSSASWAQLPQPKHAESDRTLGRFSDFSHFRCLSPSVRAQESVLTSWCQMFPRILAECCFEKHIRNATGLASYILYTFQHAHSIFRNKALSLVKGSTMRSCTLVGINCPNNTRCPYFQSLDDSCRNEKSKCNDNTC